MKKVILSTLILTVLTSISFADNASIIGQQKLQAKQNSINAKLDAKQNAVNNNIDSKIKKAQAAGKSTANLEQKKIQANQRIEAKRQEVNNRTINRSNYKSKYQK